MRSQYFAPPPNTSLHLVGFRRKLINRRPTCTKNYKLTSISNENDLSKENFELDIEVVENQQTIKKKTNLFYGTEPN